MNQKDYIKNSLELHLFFDRIMKEHALFLEVAFLEKEKQWKEIAGKFQEAFTENLKMVTSMANENVSARFLQANEIVTKNTISAERKTNQLSGSVLDTSLTENELALKSGTIVVTDQLLKQIQTLNQTTLILLQNFIQFKQDILNQVLSCKMYTTNYPLLISHIQNEAKMYFSLLQKQEKMEVLTPKDLYEQEIFWNTIMKEHAEFIRGLLDPSEQKLILTADKYANHYKNILKNSQNNPSYLKNVSLKETISFRDFKVAGEEGILNCKVKSIIIPLLADHVVREANHFIRILESIQSKN